MLNRIRWLLASVVASWAPGLGAAGADDGGSRAIKLGDTELTSVQSPHPYGPSHQGLGVIWSHRFSKPGATFVRVHFSENTLLDPDGDDELIVRDREGHIIEILRWDEAADHWSLLAVGESLTVELVVHGSRGGHGVEIDEIAFGTFPLFPEITVSGTNYFNICNTTVPARIRMADPVVRLLFQDECGGTFGCSGWLFSPEGHLMTNAHCANTQTEANSLLCLFNYMDSSCKLPGHPVSDQYAGTYNPTTQRGIKLVRMNCDLDYSVFIVNDPTKGNPADVYGFLDISLATPSIGTQLWVPQHPFGMLKQIAEDCMVTDNRVSGFNGCSDPSNGCPEDGVFVGNSDLMFNCITDQGSSGSPVLDTNNRVVALAHAGSPVDPLINYAVRMGAISGDLPNDPLELDVTGPMTVREGETAQFSAVVHYLLTDPRDVTRATATTWSVAAASAGTIDDNGLFHANWVASDRTTTISAQYTQSGFATVTGLSRITILDVPLRVTGSEPPGGSIDAGQTSDLDGVLPAGWQWVDLFFDANVSAAIPDHFVVSESGGILAAPTIVMITPIDTQTLQILLSRPISPGAWTTITHLPSNTSTQLGFLPCDVNGNETSGPEDVGLLAEFLNAVIGLADPIILPAWSTDLDRSNAVNPLDLMRAIDLLNGADGFEAWNGVELP